MKAKTIISAGVGAFAAVLGAGAAIYEAALNTKLNSFFVNYFDNPDPAQDALYNGDLYLDCQKWFEAHQGEDQTITTEKTGTIHAYIFPAAEPTHKWAIVCHGYNSSPQSTAIYTRHFNEAGYNCVCPSLRGWGNDETNYCTMGFFDKDLLLAWLDHIIATDPDAEVILHGYSMGAVTTMLATGETLPSNVKAAVCDCGFTRCLELFKYVLKYYTKLPGFPLINAANLVSVIRGNFDFRKNNPIDAVARSSTPTIFLHGTADDFIPYYMMDELYEACAAVKAKQPIEGAFHASSVMKNPDLYWEAVDSFLAKVADGEKA